MNDANIAQYPEMKVVDGDFEIELKLSAIRDNRHVELKKQDSINDRLNEVNEAISFNNRRIDELSKNIDRLTNNSDYIDYMVAACSGILAGIIDSFWVGEFSFERGKKLSDKKVNDYVINVAKKQGFDVDNYRGQDPLKGAIKYLEDKFHIPSDGIWNSDHYGINGMSHHLDDWAHHPSILGLFCSVLTQFTHKGYFSNKFGENITISVPISLEVKKDGKNEKVMLIGNNIPNKLFCGVVNWFFHLISDMAGSGKYPGAGMGIPGPIMTLLKEFSAIPGINKTNLPEKIGEIFETEKFDLRSELTIGHELGRQAIPVILNEAIVRSFYFIRHFVIEVKEKHEFSKIEWQNTIPFRNRTIIRMMTIATSTFTIVDIADAVIRGAVESVGNTAVFAKEFVLHVNFVGVGRFAIAVGTDVTMGVKREKLRNERIAILSEQLNLMKAKVYYMQANTWKAAESTKETIDEVADMMEKTTMISMEAWKDNMRSMERIGEYRRDIEKYNPGLIDGIRDFLKWGVKKNE